MLAPVRGVLAMQAAKGWMPFLALLQPQERRALYALSVAEEGMDVAAGLQPPYLEQLLDGQLEPVYEGSSKQRLTSAFDRMFIQVCNVSEDIQAGAGLSSKVLHSEILAAHTGLWQT